MGTIAGAAQREVSGSTQWASDVLAAMGNSSPNAAQLGILSFLSGVEGVPEANNNPMDISVPNSDLNMWGQIGASDATVLADEQGTFNGGTKPGIWNTFGSGEHVTTYPSYAAGVDATARFLQAGHPKIVAVLTSPNPTKLEVAQGFLADGAWGSPNSSYLGDSGAIAKWAMGNSDPTSNSAYPGNKLTSSATVELGPKTLKYLAAMGNPHTCDSTKFLITIPGIPHVTSKTGLISNCQMKAFLGGLLVGVGGVIMLFGIVTIGGGLVSQTSAGRAVLGTVNPVKRVIGAARAQQTAAPSASVRMPASPPPPAPDAGRAAARRDWEAKHGKPWSESPAARRQRVTS